jgi:signal transduction histidine kinase
MRLRGKLILTIAAVSIVPTVAAALVGRELVQLRSRSEFHDLLADGEVEVRARYRALREEVTGALHRLADPEDQFTGPILIALANGGPDDDTFRQLTLVTPRVMQERGLDVLTVLGPKGEILASGHFPGRMGDVDPRWRRVLAVANDVQIASERILLHGKPSTQVTVQAWRTVRSPLGSTAAVMGGRLLASELARSLRLKGGTELLIQDASGRLLAGPRDWRRYTSYPQRVVRLVEPRGLEAVRVTLAVPDDRLRATLRGINRAALALVISGLLLSLLLGALAANQISRRLRELVQGAEAVAAGDLDKRLPVRGRDEVADLVETFNRMTVDLRESKDKLVAAERLAAWQEIARRIAHEIKNPLFPIQTSIETLRKTYAKQHPDFEEIFNESTTMILEEVQRLKTIVTEFSQFARLPKPKVAPCDLRELIPSVAGLYGGSGGEIPIACELPADLPAVLADREQLTQVMVNLIKNAREALAGVSAPRITITASAASEGAEVSVRDNGPGFDEAVGSQIFTPYFTTKGQSGTGLGLAIVQRIITDHGGRIEARGQPGQGACFTLWLPRAG